jgi:hypothetical protein
MSPACLSRPNAQECQRTAGLTDHVLQRIQWTSSNTISTGRRRAAASRASWLSTASKNFSRLRCGLRLSELLDLTVDRVRRLSVLLVITFRRPKQALVNDHGSEALPDHCFGAAYHLIDNAGGAHQSLGLTDRFTG